MTTGAATATENLDGRTAEIIRCLRDVLTPVELLRGVSVSLKTADGLMLPIVGDSDYISAVPGGFNDVSNGAGGHSFELENGAVVIVQSDPHSSTNVNLIRAAVKGCLHGFEVDKREELLLEELGSNWERLEALYEISTDALRVGDIEEALERLIRRLAAMQAGLDSALFIQRRDVFHPLVSTVENLSPLSAPELGPIERTVRDMQVVLVNKLEPTGTGRAKWREATSVAAAPFSWQGSLGFVAVWSNEINCLFNSSFSRLLEAITYQASMMLESDRLHRKVRESELLAQEVAIASSIQQTLLLANVPTELRQIEIASCNAPSMEIDGDFHDFFQHSDGTVDVLIGDVMGKGVAAALLGAATKSQFLRSAANLALQSRSEAPPPVDIVMRAASRLSDRLIELERFVTLCYARFDPSRRKLSFVDCGHTSMIRESKAMEVCEFLRGDDLPLGVLPDYRCEEHTVDFLPGETYLLYSDGVTENRSPEGELFGEERLAECVQNWSALGPALLVEQIRKEASRFAESEKFADDFSLVAVRARFAFAGAEPIACKSSTFRSDLASLAGFRSWLAECEACLNSGPGNAYIDRLQLACSEIFANCVIHGQDCAEDLHVKHIAFADHVTVEIVQQGPAYDPLSVPTPAFDGSMECGFGIYIVVRCCDELSFKRRSDDKNVTTLSFLNRDPDRRL